MSRIVQLSGTFAERQATANAITEGLFHLQSGSNYGGYTKERWWPNISQCDVITVHGKTRVFDRQPGEERDEFSTDAYWSSDFIVVLDKPDTELFHIANRIPTYPAEAGHVHGIEAILAIVITFVFTLAVSLWFGQGSWSVVWAVAMATVVGAGFKLEYRARTFIAGLFAAFFVRESIRRGMGSREHYKVLVAHLSNADHPVVSAVHQQTLRWL